MSCSCCGNTDTEEFPCHCDSFVHPPKLDIGIGLSDIPRQIAGFPEFRRAMLYAIRPENPADINKDALDKWSARQPADLGVMLIEMWAYICDSISFYDKVISQEEYLRTALRRPSLRKLVALLGYLPRPAVGSHVWLTAQVEGRQSLKLPKGTAFRSSGFDGNPAQVFELDNNAIIHPFTNQWDIDAPRPDYFLEKESSSLLLVRKLEIKADTPLLLKDIRIDHATQANLCVKSEMITGKDAQLYQKVTLASLTRGLYHLSFARIQLLVPTQSTGLWKIHVAGNPHSIASDGNTTILTLDSLQRQIKTGDRILVRRGDNVRWFLVRGVLEGAMLQTDGNSIVINGSTFRTPPVLVPVTRIKIDASHYEWAPEDASLVVVYFSMQTPGDLCNESKTSLSFSDPLSLTPETEKPEGNCDPIQFMLTDKNFNAVRVGARIDYESSSLELDSGTEWTQPLKLPVRAFGNLVNATRGESVLKETLGSGDASVVNQTFKLKKKPLTYFPAPTENNERGVQSTLAVYVDGVRWAEVAGFFGILPNAEVFIVRQDDDGDSFVTFGDGIRGRRLTSGVGNVVVNYRFGAERPAPPAAAITQISKPVKGLSTVNNPVAVSGGDDREPAEGLRNFAPKSILTLGRIVSIDDVTAVSMTVAGVRAVQTEWGWQADQQCPLIHVWYVGAPGVEETLTRRLRSMSDPSIVIHAAMANPIASTLAIDLEIDPRYVDDDVINNLRVLLQNPDTGILAPEHVGIGIPLFRSKIFEVALSVAGVVAVRHLTWNTDDFSSFAQSPDAGDYYDFEEGALIINSNG